MPAQCLEVGRHVHDVPVKNGVRGQAAFFHELHRPDVQVERTSHGTGIEQGPLLDAAGLENVGVMLLRWTTGRGLEPIDCAHQAPVRSTTGAEWELFFTASRFSRASSLLK